MNSGAAFVWIDRHLDSTRSGPTYLAQEPIAREVVASLGCGILLGHYDLAAYAILSNHMHLLLLPKISPSRLLQSLKGASARQANRILGRTGETFWQAESYDHWVRDEGEWKRIVTYIEDNPVKAGWSSVPRTTDGRAHHSRWEAPRRVSALQTRVSAPHLSMTPIGNEKVLF